MFFHVFYVFPGLRITIQPAKPLRHPVIENRFAMGRMPAGTTFSYGLCSKCTDLAESLPLRAALASLHKKISKIRQFIQKRKRQKKSIAFSSPLTYNVSNIEMQSRFICVKCFPDRELPERRKE